MIGIITFIAALMFSSAQSASRYLGDYTLPLREGKAEIHGRVLDALSEKPVVDLEVLLFEVDADGVRGAGPRPRSTITHTDAAGKFSIAKFAAGSYQIRVTGKTHLASCIGTSRADSERCDRIQVDDDQIQRDVVIVARPAAIIRGRVVDHDGRPVSGASVDPMYSSPELGLEHTKSDADGRFEIGAIPPGDAILIAEFPVANGRSVRAYYPGVWELDEALPIATVAGQPANIEFRLPKAVMGSISARVLGPEGFKLDRFEYTQAGSMMALKSTFEKIDNLREGRYLFEARGSADGKQYAAFKQVDVSDGDTEAVIVLEEAGVINGRIVAEKGGVPPLESGGVSAWWLIDDEVVGAVRVDVSADGVFVFPNIFGDRIFKVGLAPGWRVVSIRADGKDVTDAVLHVASGSRTSVTITVGRQ